MKEVKKVLSRLQAELKAPKSQENKFGGYKYRSCEDILEAVKPLLKDTGAILTLTDEIVNIGTRFYVKATATLYLELDGSDFVKVEAFARECETKKGMDESQITGAASSYARKYALNGLFLIDDTKDADTDEHAKQTKEDVKKPVEYMTDEQNAAINALGGNIEKLKVYLKTDKITKQQAIEAIALLEKRNRGGKK